MIFQTQLRIPGPTPLPERVVRSMNRPMIDHRGPEFAAILAEITAGAKRVFKTSNDLLLLTSSGTGGLESAVANLVSPGDEVVVALCGNFGERFAALAAAYGADVVRLEFEWGQPVDPDDLAAVLRAAPEGEGRPAHAQRNVDRSHQPAAGARARRPRRGPDRGRRRRQLHQLDRDRDRRVGHRRRGQRLAEGLDGAAGLRPGQRQRARVGAAGEGALAALLLRLEGSQDLGREGHDAVHARGRRRRSRCRKACACSKRKASTPSTSAMRAWRAPRRPGLRRLASSSTRRRAIARTRSRRRLPPPGLDVAALRKLLNDKYGVVIAGGQGKMTGKMIRVGHLGAVAEGDVVQVLWAIEQALEELDIAPADGRGVAAVTASLQGVAAATR